MATIVKPGYRRLTTVIKIPNFEKLSALGAASRKNIGDIVDELISAEFEKHPELKDLFEMRMKVLEAEQALGGKKS